MSLRHVRTNLRTRTSYLVLYQVPTHQYIATHTNSNTRVRTQKKKKTNFSTETRKYSRSPSRKNNKLSILSIGTNNKRLHYGERLLRSSQAHAVAVARHSSAKASALGQADYTQSHDRWCTMILLYVLRRIQQQQQQDKRCLVYTRGYGTSTICHMIPGSIVLYCIHIALYCISSFWQVWTIQKNWVGSMACCITTADSCRYCFCHFF